MATDDDADGQGSHKTSDGRVRSARRGVKKRVENGKISEADGEAILRFEAAFDPENATETLPHDLYDSGRRTSHKTPGTRGAWLERLRFIATELELTEVEADDINEYTTDKVQSGTWVAKTAKSYEETLKKFYRYHTELGIQPREIVTHEPDRVKWGHRDMLDADERHALTVEAPSHPRDEAIVNLLMYTGMRNTALRMCRVKDIDLEEGVYYFNSEADGLKGIHNPRQPRPLLHAEAAVREWLQYHPNPDPEAYLITSKPAYSKVDEFDPVSDKTIGYVMRELTKEAFEVEKTSEFEKPTHPHMLRHNFVTICKRNWELPDETVKHLIGHAPNSTVMETTYSHLSGGDHIDRAQVGAGLKDESDIERNPDVPEVCRGCGNPLSPDAAACEKCGIRFRATVRDDVEDDMWEDKGEAEGDEEEAIDKLKRLLRENPELYDELKSDE